MIRNGWRLAVGTLTALRVAPPTVVDAPAARWAAVLAPFAFVPVAAVAGAWCVVADAVGLSPLVAGLGFVAVLALGTRILHWDGLSDVADGLTASYDRERSLQVMKSGTSGPAGVVAVVLVAGLQAAGAAGVLAHGDRLRDAALVAVAACLARWALLGCCVRGVGSARPDGLGRAFAGSVPVAGTVAGLVVAAAVTGVLGRAAGLPWWQGVLAAALAATAVGLIVQRACRRFGGITGDVFGATIEIALAVLLVALSA